MRRAFLVLAFSVWLLSACAAPVPTPEPNPGNLGEPTPAPLLASPTPDFSSEPPPPRAEREFSTDFSLHSVSYSEILSGGPPKDGIPAIDNPRFIPVTEVDTWIRPAEPVILVQVGNEARAYPLQILMWHEIINDTVAGEPLVITFCPLCNTAIAFRRVVDGQVTTFGTTGRLRYSNLIMYDRLTETWWQQATGDAIAGTHTGAQLEFYPATIISWEEFKAAFPNGLVLSRETGFSRDYGRNPYAGYDDINNSPFLYRGPAIPGQLSPMARVLTIDLNGEAVAYPYEALAESGVVNDSVGDVPVVIFWQPDVTSPLDAASVAGGRTVGSASAFSSMLNGEQLTFTYSDGVISDQETGSIWNALGVATGGTLAGEALTPVIAIHHFWFSWAAFKPETQIYTP